MPIIFYFFSKEVRWLPQLIQFIFKNWFISYFHLKLVQYDLFPSASWKCYSLSLPVFILPSMQRSLDHPHITPPLSAKKHIFISIIVWEWEVPFFSGLSFYHYSVCISLHPLFCLWMTDPSTFFSPLVFVLNNHTHSIV